MPITSSEAVDIASEHGLTMADAGALAILANDADEARTLAAKLTSATPKADPGNPGQLARRVPRSGIR